LGVLSLRLALPLGLGRGRRTRGRPVLDHRLNANGSCGQAGCSSHRAGLGEPRLDVSVHSDVHVGPES
jgi:hypothetical protein